MQSLHACRELSLLKRVRTGGGFDPKRDSRNVHAGLLFALPCWRGTSKPARTFQMHARAGSLEDAELSAGRCEIKAGIGVDFACVTFARASPFDCAKNEDMESSRQPQPPARVAGPSQVVAPAQGSADSHGFLGKPGPYLGLHIQLCGKGKYKQSTHSPTNILEHKTKQTSKHIKQKDTWKARHRKKQIYQNQ